MFPGFFTSPETLWKFPLTFPRLWKNIWDSWRRWRKRRRTSMPWSRKNHERIEEKKQEATQQHLLQLSRNSRYFAWYRMFVLAKYNQALPENGRRLVLRQRDWTLWLHRNLCKEKSGKGGRTYEWLWNALHRFDDTWYCRYDLNSIYRSYEKVTAPQPKDCGYFS